ncbi:zinc ribbon domain-containing protein [Longibaculum muris]|uniref:zinc ribbon domain-containing protein n=1 Tax=Longibaculum muris TaxID=1796628 RepID=UPI0012B93134|nr:zinc ribbon domain-containing protein [Longibaculum muris]
MHKKLKLLFLGLMVCLLTGCMKMNIYTEVKSDKTMKMNIEYLIDETTFQGSEITAQDWLNEMKDNYLKDKQKDMTFQPIDKTIDGKKWVGFKITTDDQKQSKYLTEKDIDGTKSIVFTIPMNQVSHQLGNSLGGVPQNSSLDDLKAKGVEMNLTVKMPAKASSNIGTVDGREVKIDLLEASVNGLDGDIVISSAASGGIDMTLIFTGLGIVLIVVIVVVLMKKKKAPINEELIESHDMKYCPNCGQEVGDERICSNCGYELKK